MNPIWYVGEVDGRVDLFSAIDQAAIRRGIKQIVQVGNLGIRKESACRISHYLHKIKRQNKHQSLPTWYVTGGDEDNWSGWIKESFTPEIEIANRVVLIRPGHITRISGTPHLFLGALSTGTETHTELSTVQESLWSTMKFRLDIYRYFTVVGQDTREEIVHPLPKTRTSVEFTNRWKHIDAPSHWFYGRLGAPERTVLGRTTYLSAASGGWYWERGLEITSHKV